MKQLFTIVILFVSFPLLAQLGSIKGKVIDGTTQEAIPFANVVIEGTQNGTATDFDGNFTISNVNPGYVKLDISVVGYERKLWSTRLFSTAPQRCHTATHSFFS